MKLSTLISDCDLPAIQWLHTQNSHCEVHLCLPADAYNIRASHTIYIGSHSHLPLSSINKDDCFICTGKKPKHNFNCGNILHTTLSPTKTLEIVAKRLASEQLLNAARGTLIDAQVKNKGLQYLLDIAEAVLENPMVVVDSGYKILALNSNLAQMRPDLARQQELGYMLEANIEEMRRLQLYEKAREKHYPYYSKEEKTGRGWITALVYADNIEVAQLGVMECNREFGHTDFELVHFLCHLIGLELQKSDLYINNSGLMHSMLLHDLLEGLVQDEETAIARSAPLGWKLSEAQQLLCVFDQNYGVFDRKARKVCETLRTLLPQSHWVIYQNKIVFLLPQPIDDNSSILEFLSVNHLYAAASESFNDLLSLPIAYKQALVAYDYGTRLNSANVFHYYSHYTFHHMAQIIASQCSLQSFCHPIILQIADYDRKNSTEFIQTLKAYLQFTDNPSLAAEKLFIHKNTLFYRINKIKELFNLQINSGNERARIQITIAFLECSL